MQLKIPDNSSISKTELLKMQDTIESWRGGGMYFNYKYS